MANRDVLKGQWQQLKGKVKEEWGELTDDEVTQMSGEFDQLVGSLQEKYGWSKEEAEKQADNWLDDVSRERGGRVA